MNQRALLSAGLGLALLAAGCGNNIATGPAEPTYAGPGKEGYRVIVVADETKPETFHKEAEREASNAGICPHGFDVVSWSRRTTTKTLFGDSILNVVIACKPGL